MLFILFRTNYTTVFNFHSTLVYLTKHEILQPDPLASKSVSFKPHGSFIHKGNSACLDDAELLSWWGRLSRNLREYLMTYNDGTLLELCL